MLPSLSPQSPLSQQHSASSSLFSPYRAAPTRPAHRSLAQSFSRRQASVSRAHNRIENERGKKWRGRHRRKVQGFRSLFSTLSIPLHYTHYSSYVLFFFFYFFFFFLLSYSPLKISLPHSCTSGSVQQSTCPSLLPPLYCALGLLGHCAHRAHEKGSPIYILYRKHAATHTLFYFHAIYCYFQVCIVQY